MVDFTNVVAKVAMGQDKLMADRQEAVKAQEAAQAEARKPRWKFVKTISPFSGIQVGGKDVHWHRPIRHKTNSLAPFGVWETTSLDEAKEMRQAMNAGNNYVFEQTEPEVLEHEKQIEQGASTPQQENSNEHHEEGQSGIQQQVGNDLCDGIQVTASGSPGEGHQSHQPGEHAEVGTELV